MVQLKSPREIDAMFAGGQILYATHEAVRAAVRPGVSTLDLDRVAEEFIRSHPGATPSFKGLYGFPGSICASINEEIVHGIPSAKRVLKDGDIISVDIGVFHGGLHTDSARTWPVGTVDAESERLLRVTAESLEAGIAQCVVGNHIGDIGHAIEAVVIKGRLAVVRELVGHGVGFQMHEEPQVPNHGKPKRGMKLVPGLTLAIEPMVNLGTAATRTLSDKWTVVTADGQRSAHFEHTVAITDAGPRVLTRP
ncbi:MAG: type I methionyl aminopeptidase [Gemmatimonadetes bacterium]|nr:type I methionyl aminopeptidase [Gemmatimonadota bacterium]MBI3566739.1 type I methionyl aminopeptidase [Gemmatimonadota bacterium]